MTQRPGTIRSALVVLTLLATYALTHASAAVEAPPAPALGQIPLTLAGYTGETAPALAPEVAKVLAADQYVHRYYRGPGGIIEMDIAYYGQPRVGASMHSPLNCLPGNGWELAHVTTSPVSTTLGEASVRTMTVARGDARFALTYWFQSRNRIVSDEFATRFYLLADALRRRPTDAGLVRLIMPVAGNGAAQQATLTTFAGRLIPELAQHLH